MNKKKKVRKYKNKHMSENQEEENEERKEESILVKVGGRRFLQKIQME
jgi:hypothetical protein